MNRDTHCEFNGGNRFQEEINSIGEKLAMSIEFTENGISGGLDSLSRISDDGCNSSSGSTVITVIIISVIVVIVIVVVVVIYRNKSKRY